MMDGVVLVERVHTVVLILRVFLGEVVLMGSLVIWMRVIGNQLGGFEEELLVMMENPLIIIVEALVARMGLEWVGRLMIVMGDDVLAAATGLMVGDESLILMEVVLTEARLRSVESE